MPMPGTPPNELYAATRNGLIEIARTLTPDEAEIEVPLCPGWSVKDAVAHVCGINSDLLAKQLAGLGSDEWTARQVSDRADLTIQQVCDEWTSYRDAIDALFRDDPFMGTRLVADLIVHVQDVQDALELPIDTQSEATMVAAHRYVPPLQERALERVGVSLTVEFTDGSSWPGPEGETVLQLRCTPYDFLRSVTGRRSRQQVAALDWTGDPSALLDLAWTSYGPLLSADVAV